MKSPEPVVQGGGALVSTLIPFYRTGHLPEGLATVTTLRRDRRAGRRVKVTGSLFRPSVPPGAVYIGRQAPGLARSPYANPHPIGKLCRACAGTVHDRDGALTAYAAYLHARPDLITRARTELAGRDLACWCRPGMPCHGDVLLTVVNTADLDGDRHDELNDEELI